MAAVSIASDEFSERSSLGTGRRSVLSELSSASSNTSNRPTSTEESKKIGRPSQWTDSRQRKLARLYLYSNLPPKDIRQALQDENDNWLPEKETTTKTFNALLDKDPRWLRPRNQEEMDQRVSELGNCKAQRHLKRQLRQARLSTHFDAIIEESITDINYFSNKDQALDSVVSVDEPTPVMDQLSWTQFTQTPLQDLLTMNLPMVEDDSLKELWDLVDGDLNINGAFTSATLGPLHETGIVFEEPGISENRLTNQAQSRSLNDPLSSYTPLHVDDITNLLQTYSIYGSSCASTTDLSRRYSIDTNATVFSSPGKPLPRSHPTKLALPSAFLVADLHKRRQGPCFSGLRVHDAGICWCMRDLDLVPKDMRWEPHLAEVAHLLSGHASKGLGFQDIFKNTVLHLLAARGEDPSVLVVALTMTIGTDRNAKNTAGQTFLHCFPSEFLIGLASNAGSAFEFLETLEAFKVDFKECDTFGRRFAHLFTYGARNIVDRSFPRYAEIFDILSDGLPPKRDAFGWLPPDPKTPPVYKRPYEMTWLRDHWVKDPTDIEDLSQQAQRSARPGSGRSSIENGSKEIRKATPPDDLVTLHARLLETAASALGSPTAEDLEGRNGLHCLAEVSLDLHKVTDVLHARAKTPSKKRKRGQIESDPSDRLSSSLEYRFELVQQMIKSRVDVNDYDKSGNTVLMAFVTHLHDGENNTTLSAMLRYLIDNGADVNRRNRHGETALHMAVRLGRKIATAVLLDKGANIHARTFEGKGVLAVGERHYFEARTDPALYASIMACMALCIHHGAVAKPTLVQEWSPRPSHDPRRILKV